MKKIYCNWSCKVFPGFYESNLYNSDTLYNFEYGCLPDNFTWEFKKDGFRKFMLATCEEWVSAMRYCLDNSKYADKTNPLNLKIKGFVSTWSPKEYNFYTDKINLRIEVNLNELKKYCLLERRDDFNKYLHEHWSDRPGFWSFIPNNVYGFEDKYKKCSHERDELQDVMIEWYLLEFIDFESVEWCVAESDWERISENVTLQSEEDWSLWDYEYDGSKYVPTHKLEVA